MIAHPLTTQRHALDVVATCRRSGRSIEDIAEWLHANGWRPIDVQRFTDTLATIGYVTYWPGAPLIGWAVHS